MAKTMFSVSVHFTGKPEMVVSLDRVSCWFEQKAHEMNDTGDDVEAYGAVTIHLPKEPAELRAMAADLTMAADAIESKAAEKRIA